MAATNKPRTRTRAPANGRANGNGHRSLSVPLVLELTSGPAEDLERIPIFSVDGTEYTIPADVPAYVSLEAQELLATQGMVVAERWLMVELLGQDGWDALRSCKTLTRAQYRKLAASIVEHAMGPDEDEGPKAP